MAHTRKKQGINAHEKLHDIDRKLGELWSDIGKLDALANLIDLRTDNMEWQASDRAQFATYLCCGLITKLFQDFSATHDEYQEALFELKKPSSAQGVD